MESRPPYRAGIIGTARVGSWYDDLLGDTPELIPSSHAGCYSAHPRTRVAAGSDLDREPSMQYLQCAHRAQQSRRNRRCTTMS